MQKTRAKCGKIYMLLTAWSNQHMNLSWEVKVMQRNNKPQLSDKSDIGLAIWNAIEKSGLSREYVASRIGVTLRMVNYWQTGTKQPSLVKAVQLAELLDCTLDSLLRN
jgi:ribosome-binding protein aMBF1 (putative translation factor)